ncbi:hypothetical protein BDY17DRAFT_162187 [Neohortaea acidophila]|uniref:Uncharacterized protein n=1 Tax=Neohortaea acidophila TaxID=245834 RepID=A0A6A6PRM9_9PEZI|nr:uncharacterized protein BDY17DRAFT_162187 [Neohortaea acidophila]KAF2482575.1 hypothetical protein BDY17DRAFT_162187 [Neohortaea acidophila]
MSVDDMLWWLYDTYEIVVGTRTIRRVFERKGDKVKAVKGKTTARRKSRRSDDDEEDEVDGGLANVTDAQLGEEQQTPNAAANAPYDSPYAPMSAPGSSSAQIENQLRQAMQQQTPQHPYPALMDLTEGEIPEDPELIELQLQQIALQKREVELKLKMRRLNRTPGSKGALGTPQSAPSSLFDPVAALGPTPPKRDSRSKKKIEESKRRTAERQERMLRDLERRSRRRDHLTAEWVLSKDIWPLRAQALLADLMHRYGCYAYSPQSEALFDAMYRELYQLVDLSKGDWDPHVHDEMLRERMKRKMGQLRTKMQKTGEIIGRGDGYGGFQKSENYTGETAGNTVGDESELVQDPALHDATQALQQAQPGAAPPPSPSDMQGGHPQEHLQYDPVPPDHELHHHHPPPPHMGYPNPIMHHQGPGQYPMMDQHHNMLPYAPMGGQQGMSSHQDDMVM